MFLVLIFFLSCTKSVISYWIEMSNEDDKQSTNVIINLTAQIITDTDERLRTLEMLRLENFRSASFEIGFLNYLIVENYRKMVDVYNTSFAFGHQLYPMEVVMYLYELEQHYWQIEHLCNMQQEVERKYRVVGDLKGKPDHTLASDATVDHNDRKKRKRPKDREDWLKQKMMSVVEYGTTRKKSTRWWWPIEYGWEIEKWW